VRFMRAVRGPASSSARTERQAGPIRRDRFTSAPKSVQFRTEIGRTPPRNRFTSAPRSVLAGVRRLWPHPAGNRNITSIGQLHAMPLKNGSASPADSATSMPVYFHARWPRPLFRSGRLHAKIAPGS